jgi:hypothetical protein
VRYRLIAIMYVFVIPANLVSINLYDITATGDPAELVSAAAFTLTTIYKSAKIYEATKLKDANPALILAGAATPFVALTAAVVAGRIVAPLLRQQFPLHRRMIGRSVGLTTLGVGTASIVGPILLSDHEMGLGSSIVGIMLMMAFPASTFAYNPVTDGLVQAGRSLLNTLGIADLEQEEPAQNVLEHYL